MLTIYGNEAESGKSTYVRGRCINRTRLDPNCPPFYLSPSRDDNYSGVEGVAKCEAVGNQDMYYCSNNVTTDVNCASMQNVLLFSGEISC